MLIFLIQAILLRSYRKRIRIWIWRPKWEEWLAVTNICGGGQMFRILGCAETWGCTGKNTLPDGTQTGKHDSSFANEGVKSAGKLANEDFGVGHLCCVPQLIIAHTFRVDRSVANVLRYWRRKQRRLLRAHKHAFHLYTTPLAASSTYTHI